MFRFIWEFITDIIIPAIITILVIALVVGFVYSLYSEFANKDSSTIVLETDRWKCTETASKKTSILVGKVITTQYHDVCITYSMNKE